MTVRIAATTSSAHRHTATANVNHPTRIPTMQMHHRTRLATSATPLTIRHHRQTSRTSSSRIVMATATTSSTVNVMHRVVHIRRHHHLLLAVGQRRALIGRHGMWWRRRRRSAVLWRHRRMRMRNGCGHVVGGVLPRFGNDRRALGHWEMLCRLCSWFYARSGKATASLTRHFRIHHRRAAHARPAEARRTQHLATSRHQPVAQQQRQQNEHDE